jgi:HEAT repeat protein
MILDPRDRESIGCDLVSSDDEVRRLAVERLPMLPVGEALPMLAERLGDESWRVRKSAVACLASVPEDWPVAEQLIAALADGDNPGRRNAAVEALVRSGRRMVEPLLGMLESPDVDVRKLVIDALAGIGSERAVPQLAERLGDPDPNVRAAAADALGAIGGSEAIRALSDTVLREDQEPLVSFSALRGLARLEVPLEAGALKRALSDPLLRPVAFSVLGQGDEPEALDVLLAGLAAGSRAAREAACEALLRRLCRADPSDAERLGARIRACVLAAPATIADATRRLGEAELGVRLLLVQFLGIVRAPESVIPLLLAARDEALAEVALSTLVGFGAVADAEIDGCFHALDVEVRALACELLGRTTSAGGAQRLIAALADTEPTVRIAAARGLAGRSDPAATSALLRRLEVTAGDPEPEAEEERNAAIDALVQIATAAPEAEARRTTLDLLAGGFEGAEVPIRLAMARVLREVGSSEHAEHMSLLVQDPSSEVRRAAVAALARMGPDVAAEMLRLALADEDVSVRIAAAAALGEGAKPRVLPDLERLLSDEDASVRAAAVRAITGFAPALSADAAALERVESLLRQALTDVAPVAIAAVEAFERIGNAVSLTPVLAILDHADAEVVQSAVRCVERHAHDSDLHSLVPLLAHEHWAVRAAVLDALARRRTRSALPAVLRHLEREQDEFVREVLLRTLAQLEEG